VKSKPFWKLSVVTVPEADEAVAALCEHVFRQPAVSYTNVETGTVTVSVYLAERPREYRAACREGLARIRHCGLKTGTGTVVVRKLNRRDWAESWKRHFPPIEIGPALLIKPGWSRRRAPHRQAVVVLDPGLSFGTGQHPTTAFCLEQLVAQHDPGRRLTFLDIGTGSGILAIAAAKLGYPTVEAFDSDREAVRIARANARRNRVLTKMRLYRADLTKPPGRSARNCDLVCANLNSTLLLSEQRRILQRLKSGGVLVLAGILKDEFPRVARAYRRAGLKLVASRTEREWRSGAFRGAR
jgi:ribosomal protein L11 methyltransferase